MSITVTDLFAGREAIEFDVSKITAAIMKAFESIQPAIDEAVENISNALAGLADTLEEYTAPFMDSFSRVSYTLLHSVMHLLMHCIDFVCEVVVTVITYNPRDAVYYTAALCVCFRSLTLEYHPHLWNEKEPFIPPPGQRQH